MYTAILLIPTFLAPSLALAEDAPAEPAAAEEAAPAPVTYDLSKSDLIIQVFKDTEGLGAALDHRLELLIILHITGGVIVGSLDEGINPPQRSFVEISEAYLSACAEQLLYDGPGDRALVGDP